MSTVKQITEEANQAAFASFIEGLLPKILPMIEPMMEGITEAFGDNEFIIVGKKDVKKNKVFMHIIKSNDIESFKTKKIAKSVELSDFFQKALSGEVKQYFDEIKRDIDAT